MKFEEVKMNLFNVPKKYYLVHCISSDAAMSAGIAVNFVKNFPYIKRLRETKNEVGDCVKIKRVFNLITKRVYYGKPLYETLQKCLEKCRDICIKENIKFLAMPKIGCGLDKLQWGSVRIIIQCVFDETDIEIKVCHI